MTRQQTVISVGIGIIVVLVVLILWADRQHVSITTKVFDCTNVTLYGGVRLQGVAVSHLILAVPKRHVDGNAPPPRFEGEVVVKKAGATIATVPVTSESVEPCNWLDARGYQGYLLAWRDVRAGQMLRSALCGHGVYEIKFSFFTCPPKDSSIWISCVSKPQWPWVQRVTVFSPENGRQKRR